MNQNPILSDELLDLIVCPIDHQSLIYIDSENVLFNDRLNKKYEVKNGIPVMLIEKAIDVDKETQEKYRANATRTTGPTNQ